MTAVLFVQMCCVNSYAVGPNTSTEYWTLIAEGALQLDKADFLEDGYKVKVGGNQGSPAARAEPSRSKRKLQVEDDDESSSDDDDEEDDDDDDYQAPLETPGTSSASSGRQLRSPSSERKSKRKKRDSSNKDILKSLVATVQVLATQTAETRSNQADFQKYLMGLQQQQNNFQLTMQAMMERLPQPQPVAIMAPPPLPSVPLLLTNQPSGSISSDDSAPPAPSAVPAPPPPPPSYSPVAAPPPLPPMSPPVAAPPPPPPASASAPSSSPPRRQVSSGATGDDSLGFSEPTGSANADTAVSPDTDAAAGGSQ